MATLHLRAGVHNFLEADDLFSGARAARDAANSSWPIPPGQEEINNILSSL